MRLFVPLAVGIVAGAAALAPHIADARTLFEDLPLIGTNGGTAFSRTCPSGHVLTGIRWRTGAVVDGIGIQCSPIRPDGSLGTRINVGTMAGGNGGTAGSGNCGSGVIAGQNGGTAGVSIGSLFFRCFPWNAAARAYTGAATYTINVRVGVLISASEGQCIDGAEPAIGIRGRHGSLVDAVGLKCGRP